MALSIFSWYKSVPVHECEYHVTSSGAILIGAAPACRKGHRKCYPEERYSRFIPSLGYKDDYDLAVTVLQKPHAFGGFGLTPNVIAQSSAKVAMATRFLALVGSSSLEEQKLWLPNQLLHDSESWTAPHLFQLKREYEVLAKDHGCQVQEMYTVQDHPPPPSEFLLLPPLDGLYKANVRNQELPQPAG
jgi:hypothetical protein